ncbi:hypothetical protein HDU79_009763 [Rhizoclosmatium sp. JEL0117]|nr:hypothetical protein HDU79_009763 [Rhizoclosmatium sp. JEL0117]
MSTAIEAVTDILLETIAENVAETAVVAEVNEPEPPVTEPKNYGRFFPFIWVYALINVSANKVTEKRKTVPSEVTIPTVVDENITETITVAQSFNSSAIIKHSVFNENPNLVTAVDIIETESSDAKFTETIVVTETGDAEPVIFTEPMEVSEIIETIEAPAVSIRQSGFFSYIFGSKAISYHTTSNTTTSTTVTFVTASNSQDQEIVDKQAEIYFVAEVPIAETVPTRVVAVVDADHSTISEAVLAVEEIAVEQDYDAPKPEAEPDMSTAIEAVTEILLKTIAENVAETTVVTEGNQTYFVTEVPIPEAIPTGVFAVDDADSPTICELTVFAVSPIETASLNLMGASILEENQPAFIPVTPPTPHLNLAGVFIDRCRELGEGGYSFVYAGIYCGTEVAVKTFKKDKQHKALQDSIEKEALMGAKLRHPNIAHILGIASDPLTGYPSLVIERLGKSIYDTLSEDPIPSVDVRFQWLCNIASAFKYLHQQNPPIVHRDLKPDNILLHLEDQRAVLADFGMTTTQSSHTSYSAQRQPKTGHILFAPPESTKQGYKPCTTYDVFSFGMTMYFILTRHWPFEGESMINYDVIVMGWIQSGQRPLRFGTEGYDRKPDLVSHSAWALIQRCWSQNEAERPTFDVIYDELNQIASLQEVNVGAQNTVDWVLDEASESLRKAVNFPAGSDFKCSVIIARTLNGEVAKGKDLALDVCRDNKVLFAITAEEAFNIPPSFVHFFADSPVTGAEVSYAKQFL